MLHWMHTHIGCWGWVFGLAMATGFSWHPPLTACTGLRIPLEGGGYVHGRTAEFGVELELSLLLVPAETEYTSTTPKGPGLHYKTKYGLVGISAFDANTVLDGINEKRLSIGAFYFPGYAEYPKLARARVQQAVAPTEFAHWLLATCGSLQEVKAAVRKAVIAPTIIQEWGPAPPPFHWVVYDGEGKSLVIEPTGGQLKVFENPLGICTNSPTFDWHSTNLINYLRLTPYNSGEVHMGELVLRPFGEGSGMKGLPGDFTSPSRFVRAAWIATTSTPAQNECQGVQQGFHALHQFDIPYGIVREHNPSGGDQIEYTQGTCMRAPKELGYYFTSYHHPSVVSVDLKASLEQCKGIQRYHLPHVWRPQPADWQPVQATSEGGPSEEKTPELS